MANRPEYIVKHFNLVRAPVEGRSRGGQPLYYLVSIIWILFDPSWVPVFVRLGNFYTWTVP